MSTKENRYSLENICQLIILGVLHFVLLATPLYFRFITEELFEFNKLILVYTATAIIVSAWVVRMIATKKILWKHSLFHIPVAIFLLSQLASTVFSLDLRTSLFGYYGRFHGGLFSLISYALLYAVVVSTVSKRHISLLLHTTFLGAFLVAVYAILEHFGYSVSCLLLSQGTEFDTACWVQQVQDRVFASFGQPNWLAAYAITLIPVGWLLSSFKHFGRSHRIFYLITTALLTIATLYTKSRSGFLGLLVGLGIFLVGFGILYLRNKQLVKNTISMNMLGIVLALFVTIVASIGSPFSPSVFSSKSEPLQEALSTTAPVPDRLSVGGTDSGEIRRIVWRGAVDVWRRYPIFGSGVETFAYSYYLDRPAAHNIVSEWDFLYNKAHNEFLNYLATTGIVGLLAYVFLLGAFSVPVIPAIFKKHTTAKNELSLSDSRLRDDVLVLALVSGIGAQAVSNFFGFSTVMISVLLFVFFGYIALLKTSDDDTNLTNIKKSETKKFSTVQQIAVLVTLLLFATVLLNVYRYWLADISFSSAKAYARSGAIDASYSELQTAIQLQPNEPLYYDELAATLAPLSIDLVNASEASAAAEVATNAVLASDIALTLNPHHLNFYKSRAQVLITLSQLDPSLLESASDALSAAIERAPTDAKLYYNRAMVDLSAENIETAQKSLETAVELKPNYIDARFELGKIYEAQERYNDARTQYQFILENLTPDNPPVRDRLEQLPEDIEESE